MTDAAKAKGIPTSDPRVLKAIDDARKLAEKRAAEDKARDELEKAQLKTIAEAITAKPVCPPVPKPDPVQPVLPVRVEDAGTGEGGS